jgi:hypothetical protein
MVCWSTRLPGLTSLAAHHVVVVVAAGAGAVLAEARVRAAFAALLAGAGYPSERYG